MKKSKIFDIAAWSFMGLALLFNIAALHKRQRGSL